MAFTNLKFCCSPFWIFCRHLSLSLRNLLWSITQVLSLSVTMPTSTKTLFATAAAALSDTWYHSHILARFDHFLQFWEECWHVWWFCYKLISNTWLQRVCACWFRLRYIICSWFSLHFTVAGRRTWEVWFYFWTLYELLVRWCQRQKNIQTFCYTWPLWSW